jgi:hypothetical protein
MCAQHRRETGLLLAANSSADSSRQVLTGHPILIAYIPKGVDPGGSRTHASGFALSLSVKGHPQRRASLRR